MLPSQSSSASSSFSTYRLSPRWFDHCKHRWDNKHPVYASPSTSTSRVTFDPTVVCSLCALWTVQNAIMCVHRVCLLPKMPVYDPSQTKQLENAFSSFFSSFLFFFWFSSRCFFVGRRFVLFRRFFSLLLEMFDCDDRSGINADGGLIFVRSEVIPLRFEKCQVLFLLRKKTAIRLIGATEMAQLRDGGSDSSNGGTPEELAGITVELPTT